MFDREPTNQPIDINVERRRRIPRLVQPKPDTESGKLSDVIDGISSKHAAPFIEAETSIDEYDGDFMVEPTPIVSAEIQQEDKESYPLIPQTAIDGFVVRDEHIHVRHTDSLAQLEVLGTYATEKREKTTSQMTKNIEDAKKEFEDRQITMFEEAQTRLNEIRRQAQMIEETIRLRYERGMTEAAAEISAVVGSFERVIRETDQITTFYKAVMQNVREEVKAGTDYQAQHEKRRDSLVGLHNELVARIHELLDNLDDAVEKRDEFEVRLKNSQDTRLDLLDEDSELRTQDRLERDEITRDDVQALYNDVASNNPDKALGLSETIKQMRRDAKPTDKLIEILGNREVLEQKLARNQYIINDYSNVIDAKKVIIHEIEIEFAQKRAMLLSVRQKLADEGTPALNSEGHSAVVAKETERLDAIMHGDTSIAAGMDIPQSLEPALDRTRRYNEVLSMGSPKYTPGEFVPPTYSDLKFDLSPIVEPDDEDLFATEVDETTKTVDGRERLFGAALNMNKYPRLIGDIASRSLFGGKKVVEFRKRPTEDSKEG